MFVLFDVDTLVLLDVLFVVELFVLFEVFRFVLTLVFSLTFVDELVVVLILVLVAVEVISVSLSVFTLVVVVSCANTGEATSNRVKSNFLITHNDLSITTLNNLFKFCDAAFFLADGRC